MINLLPQAAKKKLRTEYWMRMATSWAILWAVSFAVGACLFLPAYFIVSYQVGAYKDAADQAASDTASFKEASLALLQASQQAKSIVDEAELPLFSNHIALLQNLSGAGISLTGIHISRVEKELQGATIEGVAVNRKTLADLRDRLIANEQIETAELPISNLAQDKDIKFTITITFSKQPKV